ncbi:MAG TPA: thiamine biosynthesis protein ThiH [Lachnospiraceae bacterium]|nr:thiamine biosynthesis protein ThiH [uncultured Lachnoclostridium sp.]HAU86879.1 thiamine biosynthesis protein ThiH [Lachnospiraceae bacterium]
MKKIERYETFVPLYLTNTCDSQCKMCNMRVQNHSLHRIVPNKEKILEQLDIILNIERISAVCILTGEYTGEKKRIENLDLVIWCIKQALQKGFQKVFFNIGSLYDNEIDILDKSFPDKKNIVLSLFQETYDKECYERYFGKCDSNNPKSDYERRITTPMRFLERGFEQVDVGVLLGLNSVETEVTLLMEHVDKLSKYAKQIYISLPRICGVRNLKDVVTDNEYYSAVKRVYEECKDIKIIATTREDRNMLLRLLPYVKVISPGCSDVLPYTTSGKIKNNLETSQFQVKPLRDRPSEVLEGLPVRNAIKYYHSAESRTNNN